MSILLLTFPFATAACLSEATDAPSDTLASRDKATDTATWRQAGWAPGTPYCTANQATAPRIAQIYCHADTLSDPADLLTFTILGCDSNGNINFEGVFAGKPKEKQTCGVLNSASYPRTLTGNGDFSLTITNPNQTITTAVDIGVDIDMLAADTPITLTDWSRDASLVQPPISYNTAAYLSGVVGSTLNGTYTTTR